MTEYNNKSEDEKAMRLLERIQANQRKGDQASRKERSRGANQQITRDPNSLAASLDKAISKGKNDGTLTHGIEQQSFTYEDRHNSRQQFNEAFKPKLTTKKD